MEQPDPNPQELVTKVDLTKHKLSQAQLMYMKLVEEQNAERVRKLRRIRRSNLFTGIGLGLGVFAIFGYSIWAVGNEKFLDEGFEDKTKN